MNLIQQIHKALLKDPDSGDYRSYCRFWKDRGVAEECVLVTEDRICEYFRVKCLENGWSKCTIVKTLRRLYDAHTLQVAAIPNHAEKAGIYSINMTAFKRCNKMNFLTPMHLRHDQPLDPLKLLADNKANLEDSREELNVISYINFFQNVIGEPKDQAPIVSGKKIYMYMMAKVQEIQSQLFLSSNLQQSISYDTYKGKRYWNLLYASINELYCRQKLRGENPHPHPMEHKRLAAFLNSFSYPTGHPLRKFLIPWKYNGECDEEFAKFGLDFASNKSYTTMNYHLPTTESFEKENIDGKSISSTVTVSRKSKKKDADYVYNKLPEKRKFTALLQNSNVQQHDTKRQAASPTKDGRYMVSLRYGTSRSVSICSSTGSSLTSLSDDDNENSTISDKNNNNYRTRSKVQGNQKRQNNNQLEETRQLSEEYKEISRFSKVIDSVVMIIEGIKENLDGLAERIVFWKEI